MRVNMGREGRASSSLSANGGSMLGSLILANGPSQPLEAATKYYVDTVFANLNANNVLHGTLPISSLPAFTGDATTNQGSNSFVLSNLGVTPGSYPKVIVDSRGRVTGNDILLGSDVPNFGWGKVSNKPNTLSGYGITDALDSAGGNLTGNLTVGAPAQSMSLVNKQYVDSALSNNAAVVGDIIRKPYATTPVGFLKCNGGMASKDTYANLYAVIGDNFSVNTTPGSGRPWEQQYQINSAQSGNITGWTANTNLPVGLLYHKCVVTKNRIYMLGGGTANSRWANVYTAPLNSDGTIGNWVATTSLPGEFAYFTTFITKNRLFLIGGGTTANSVTNTVYSCVINADGTLGTWVTSTFPIALSSTNAVVIKNRVYIIGGYDGTSSLSTIYYATINFDGTIGAWTLFSTGLAVAAHSFNIAVIKNKIYIFGGYNGTTFVNTVYVTNINLDGTLGTWTLYGTIPLSLTVGCIYVTKNCVYLLGGAYVVNTYTANMYKANINQDGSLSNWESMGTLPWTTGYSTCVTVNNKIHILGGFLNSGVSSVIMTASIDNPIQDYTPYYDIIATTNYLMPGSGKPWQQQYQVNTTQTADITGWATAGSIPDTIHQSGAIVTKNRVYLIGGNNGTNVLSTVYTAPVNADGTLGAWTADVSIPETISQAQAIVTKNHVYLIGGYNGTSVTSAIYTASINADGTLGVWSASASLPGNLSLSQAIVTKNKVYMLGGNVGAGVSTVYVAPINTDGTLGTWTTDTNSLPGNLRWSQSVVTNNRVYLLGSHENSNIYTAPINSDGTIGIWSTASNPLPAAIGQAQVFVCKNKIYVVGGWNGSAYLSTVYYATINADGTLGGWVTGTALPITIGRSQLITTKNHIYLLGGYNTTGTAINTIYSATISDSLNDYSGYYDGSIIPNQPVDQSTLFALPDFTSKEKNDIKYYIKY